MLKILKVLIGILLITTLYFYGAIDPKLIDLSYSSFITYLFVIVFTKMTVAFTVLVFALLMILY